VFGFGQPKKALGRPVFVGDGGRDIAPMAMLLTFDIIDRCIAVEAPPD
jgi:hypothetical protein